MKIRQISIFLENKPHQLSVLCRALADAKINLITLSLADTADFGIVRLIVSDVDASRRILADRGFAVNVCDVVAVCVPDRPGGMAGVMEALDVAGVNIEYSYALDVDKTTKEAVIVFRFSDNDRAEASLAQAGYRTIEEKSVSEASK